MIPEHNITNPHPFPNDQHANGIVVIDSDGVIRFVNSEAEALFGRDRTELIGKVMGLPVVGGDFVEIDLVHPDRRSHVVELSVTETEWENRPALALELRDTENAQTGTLASLSPVRMDANRRLLLFLEESPK